MRPRAEYTALHVIRVNGVIGYREGDDVTAAVVDNLNLVVGSDVMPANATVIPRPDDDAAPRDWEAFAIGQGMPVPEAQAASMAELQAKYPAEQRDDVMPLRPAAKPAKAKPDTDPPAG